VAVAGTYRSLIMLLNPQHSWNCSQTSHNIYNEAMGRIERRSKSRQKLATQIFMWLTCAFRPLSVKELQHALAVKLNMTSLDLSTVYDEGTLISVCNGLVVIDDEQHVIRFARMSAACRYN
jgi:hypothetical protein